MGYTIYWTHKIPFTDLEWKKITNKYKEIYGSCGRLIEDFSYKGCIQFNGANMMKILKQDIKDKNFTQLNSAVMPKEINMDKNRNNVVRTEKRSNYGDLCSHEDFVLYKNPNDDELGELSCKTARKPYNLAVIAILLYAEKISKGKITFTTD